MVTRLTEALVALFGDDADTMHAGAVLAGHEAPQVTGLNRHVRPLGLVVLLLEVVLLLAKFGLHVHVEAVLLGCCWQGLQFLGALGPVEPSWADAVVGRVVALASASVLARIGFAKVGGMLANTPLVSFVKKRIFVIGV